MFRRSYAFTYLGICAFTYQCMYVNTNACKHVYTCMYVYRFFTIYASMYTVYMYLCTCVSMYPCICVHVYVCTHTCTNMCAYRYVYIIGIHTCIYMCSLSLEICAERFSFVDQQSKRLFLWRAAARFHTGQ